MKNENDDRKTKKKLYRVKEDKHRIQLNAK